MQGYKKGDDTLKMSTDRRNGRGFGVVEDGEEQKKETFPIRPPPNE
jgi:hypothetical protein